MSCAERILAASGAALIVAPHPDDESLGCGGLIARLVAKGGRVHVVFVTDGGASHPNSPSWSRKRLAACREREAEEALRRLGAGDQPRSFLRLKDAAMPAPGDADRERAVQAIVEIAGDLQPDLVIVPWRRDPHRDHRDSWTMTMEALRRAALAPDVLEYAIWLDEIGSAEDRPEPDEAELIELDVADVLDAKRAAIAAHVSQHGALIADDPAGFRLTPETVRRLTGPQEIYWRPCRRT